eukprot:TRINITY_DN7444_c0_g1_i1.p2 TRINITY_DN7444_c0_g1~~TRINITY_DN7444_c0_g1_i1.p2  ORF type:complete len:100 (-),score=10.63 TRINITY_DN7444_c0_g1_i1:77-376(-)
MRFADWLQPVWPGQLYLGGGWNGWLRANWTPPGDIFQGGNIRQLAASPMGEIVGTLLRNGTAITLVHPLSYYQKGVQGLGSTRALNSRGEKLIPLPGVT